MKMIQVAFYDAKAYDRPSFEAYGERYGVRFTFLETKLNEDTAALAEGYDAVCVFVNDTVNAAVIEKLYAYGVKLIALRSAGYNNVDVRAAFGKIHVVHVPAYSPYAVAEHAIALLLTSVRRIHKAYNRTKEFNFSLSGLTGFDFHGKTVGFVPTMGGLHEGHVDGFDIDMQAAVPADFRADGRIDLHESLPTPGARENLIGAENDLRVGNVKADFRGAFDHLADDILIPEQILPGGIGGLGIAQLDAETRIGGQRFDFIKLSVQSIKCGF